MISIKLTYKDGDTESFIFHKSTVTVGRSGENDIKVVSASGVSRHHLKLIVEAGQIVVEDLNSTNGTLLNSVKINREIVGVNDIIEVGDACIKATLKEEKTSNPIIDDVEDLSSPKLKEVIQEALDKIMELPVIKVIILPDKKVKYIEHDKELNLDLIYSKQDLSRLSRYYCGGKKIHTEKVDENIKCTIFNSGSLETYIYLEKVNFLNKARSSEEATGIISNAIVQGKNILFAGQEKKAIQMLMSEFMANYRFATIDKFKNFSLNEHSIRLSALNKIELLTVGQFSKEIMFNRYLVDDVEQYDCLLYTSPSPRDQRGSRMPSSA